MKMGSGFRGAIAITAVAFCPWTAVEAQVYPKRGIYSSSTGMIAARFSNGAFRGSGVIARDPRLIYSCAHVLYSAGQWATDYEFYRELHSESRPDSLAAALPRGFRHFASYSSLVDLYGESSLQAYAADFVVYYSDIGFGEAVGYWLDGGEAMRSNRWKRIVGYPSRLDHTGASGYFYQHGTDWFDQTGIRAADDYHRFTGVSTGPGNSGGPLFVHDSTTDTDYLAGIVVSGLSNSAGAHALGQPTNRMASAALGIEPVTRTYSNTTQLRLPDHSRKFKRRAITASGFAEGVTSLSISMNIAAARRGDLAVYLRSPGGRVHWLHKPYNSTRRHLRLSNHDLTHAYGDASANGRWVLHMRDAKKGKRATFREFSLTITAPAEP